MSKATPARSTASSAASSAPSLSGERFGFTVFLSACVHVILIAGVGFSFLSESPQLPAIEITLAQYRSEQAPDQADYVAQMNQAGSGSLEERVAPSTPFVSDFHDNVIQEVVPLPTSPSPTPQTDTDLTLLTTHEADTALNQQPEEVISESEAAEADHQTPEDISLAIATLQARLDRQQQAYANRPRRHTISSASTRERHDAEYLDAWRQRIESVGNRHYPAAARQQDIFGSLRMLVGLRPDGSVHEIRILQTSGHRVLDEAAVDIVRLSAPFEPFPPELRGEVDILEIIRTWRFQPGHSLTSN